MPSADLLALESLQMAAKSYRASVDRYLDALAKVLDDPNETVILRELMNDAYAASNQWHAAMRRLAAIDPPTPLV